MISIYEAVVSNTTPIQKKPVPGAVVPQIQPQQSAQQQNGGDVVPQVQAQQNMQQPAGVAAVQPVQNQSPQPVDSTGQQIGSYGQPEQNGWKKGLKIAALIGAGLGAGGLIHAAYNNDMLHFSPNSIKSAFSWGSDNNEGSEEVNDDSDDSSTLKTKRLIRGNVSQPPKTIAKPISYDNDLPEANYRRPRDLIFGVRRPANQPNSPFGSATMVKQLDQATGRQYYAPRGGYGVGYYGDNSEWADNYSSDTTSHSGIHVRPKRGGSFNPINDFDHGRRSGLY